MSGVELSIGVNGIANTSVCVPVSGGTSMHEGAMEIELGSLGQTGMVSVITVQGVIVKHTYKVDPTVVCTMSVTYFLNGVEKTPVVQFCFAPCHTI